MSRALSPSDPDELFDLVAEPGDLMAGVALAGGRRRASGSSDLGSLVRRAGFVVDRAGRGQSHDCALCVDLHYENPLVRLIGERAGFLRREYRR